MKKLLETGIRWAIDQLDRLGPSSNQSIPTANPAPYKSQRSNIPPLPPDDSVICDCDNNPTFDNNIRCPYTGECMIRHKVKAPPPPPPTPKPITSKVGCTICNGEGFITQKDRAGSIEFVKCPGNHT